MSGHYLAKDGVGSTLHLQFVGSWHLEVDCWSSLNGIKGECKAQGKCILATNVICYFRILTVKELMYS